MAKYECTCKKTGETVSLSSIDDIDVETFSRIVDTETNEVVLETFVYAKPTLLENIRKCFVVPMWAYKMYLVAMSNFHPNKSRREESARILVGVSLSEF